MRLLIIRHGDPDYSIDNLTEKGKREVELLSQKLIHENITKIYSSPLGRAKATAAPTAEKLGMDVEILDWLTEYPAGVDLEQAYIDYGIDPKHKNGCPWNTLPQYWTLQDEYFDRHKWQSHPVIQNSKISEVYERVGNGFNELMKRHGYIRNGQIYDIVDGTDETQTIALFCHLGLGLALVSNITTGALPFIWQSFFLPTTSVTTVLTEKYPPYPKQAVMRILGVGDCGHLIAGNEPISTSGLHSNIE